MTDMPTTSEIAAYIYDAACLIEDGWAIGLRVDRLCEVGTILPPSRAWVDGSPTDHELPGTSAISLRSSTQLDSPVTYERVDDALDALESYVGSALVLIAGERVCSGEDAGEVLIRGAEVIASWERP